MARPRKTIKHEKKKAANTEAESPTTLPDNGAVSNDVELQPDSGSNLEETSSETINEEIASQAAEYSDVAEITETVNTEESTSGEVAPTEVKKRTRKPRKSKEVEQPKAAFKVPGKLFIGVLDKVFSGVIVSVDTWVSKYPVKKEWICLSKDQLEDAELITLAEEALKEMKLESKPIPVFFGTLGMIYITNYMHVRAEITEQLRQANEQATSTPPSPEVDFGKGGKK